MKQTVTDRAAIQQQIIQALEQEQITLGQAVQKIRTQLYTMTQAKYANLCQVSEKTLRDIEKGATDPRLSIVQRLLRPGGMTLSARLKTNRVQSMSERIEQAINK